ncbi:MAG: hypothetical protein KAV87_24350 [Desulfobacteraceae bacterium]|nr:hypothetical protein [Desulfobacteraceae bacterium]
MNIINHKRLLLFCAALALALLACAFTKPVEPTPVEPKLNFDENCPLLEVATWIEENNDMTDRMTVFLKISGTGEKNTFVENVDNMVTVGNLYYEWKDVTHPPCLKELHGLYEEALYHLMYYYIESADDEFLSADEEIEKSLASLDEFATMRELFGLEHFGEK